MSSARKIDTNRANARRSSGPTSASGKNNSRRNAAKHGFFSPELLLSDAEKVEFQALRRALRSQLHPTTALQSFELGKIVFCAWRCKLAARQEMRQLSVLFDIPRDGKVQPEEPTGSAAMVRWFGSGRRELNDGIRILEALKQQVESKGRIPEEWKEQLDRAFGVDFYESLVKWPTMSLDAIRLADHLVRHRATFGRCGSGEADQEPPKVILDPVQNLNMVCKLIEQLLHFLRDLARSWEYRVSGSAGAQTAGPTDFAPRYFTTASRDLHRAVEWYAHLKERNL